jgi:integrase
MIKFTVSLSIRLFRKVECFFKRKSSKDNKHLFVKQAHLAIEKLSTSRSRSTCSNYETALKSFAAYAGDELQVTDVCKQTIEGWALQLKQQGLRLNTMSCYMRSLRSIIAHSDMCLHADDLFKGVFTGNEHTRKRSISAEMLRRIRELKIPPSSPMALVHDVFMFSVYALGMPFVDVAFLQKQQIRNGYIDYQRHKTGQRIHIKVEPVMQRIINRHIRNDTPYVFPILRHGTMLEYQKARGSYNHQLRKLGLLAGVCNLTSYVARHSWASMAYQQNVDLSVISKALGHTSPNTTLIYIREIDDNRIDVANKKLLGKLTSKQKR